MNKRKRRKRDRKVFDYEKNAYRIYLPKGVLYFPDGQKVELYSKGVIADILTMDWREIRKWELEGLIPLSPFCDSFGRRLYTKDMIRTISQCAEEYKIPVRGGKCRLPFKRRIFFINLAIRLEKLYRVYEARLEMQIPEEFQIKNRRYIRKYVLQSTAYKEYLLRKEAKKNDEAHKEEVRQRRREAFWRRWKQDAKFRKQVYDYFIRRERYYERRGWYDTAEKIRQGRRKYYDENGNCIVDCET